LGEELGWRLHVHHDACVRVLVGLKDFRDRTIEMGRGGCQNNIMPQPKGGQDPGRAVSGTQGLFLLLRRCL